MQKQLLEVKGMSCASCASGLQSHLEKKKGIKNASVNFASQSAEISYEDNIGLSDLQNYAQEIGYELLASKASLTEIEKAETAKLQNMAWKLGIGTFLSSPIVYFGMFDMENEIGRWLSFALSALVLGFLGTGFYQRAFKQIRHWQFSMDTLVSLGTGVAFLYSSTALLFPSFWSHHGAAPHLYFEAAVVILCFISLGKYLEERAKASTSASLKKLMGMQAKDVSVLRNGVQSTVAITELQENDLVLLKPGESIPVDGEVEEGFSYVNESMLSGEPIPVEKKAGDKVFAGTINQQGSLQVRCKAFGEQTLLSQIIERVKQAQASKAPVQALVDKISAYFVPIVLLISILTLTAWLFFPKEASVSNALMSMVNVLVIACPCALGLATPTAIMVGVGKGAEMGILVRDAASLELGSKVKGIVLDKTGTITMGEPQCKEEHWWTEKTEEKIDLLVSMLAMSEHPLSIALHKHFQASLSQTLQLEHFEAIPGKGTVAHYQKKSYAMGSLDFVRSFCEQTDLQLPASWSEKPYSLVCLVDKEEAIACFALYDEAKKGSKAAIAELQKDGYELFMFTGDRETSAKHMAKEMAIPEKNVRFGMSPSGKAEELKKLQGQGWNLAMVGDGINDAQALTQADLSIAMGKGTDIAKDLAMITLASSDLRGIRKALRLSRNTVRGIKQNLFWAFFYNLLCLPLAAGCLYPINGFMLDPMFAGAAMALSSVSVVANSLRIKYLTL